MLKKGSQAAKNYMAKLRAAKGKSKPKKLGALPVGFIGKMWGVQFKVQNQFDIYNNVQCICENKITGKQFCIINGIKKDVPNQVAKFYDHILQNTDVSVNDSDLKILGILKKDITKFLTNLSNEVDKYNKGQKVTSPVKNINIPKPTTLKKIKVLANKKIQINDIKGKPIKKKGNPVQRWEFTNVNNKDKGKLLGVKSTHTKVCNIGSIDLNTVGKELEKLQNDILELGYLSRQKKSFTLKEISTMKKLLIIKKEQFKNLKLYLNSIAKFR